MMLQGKNAVVYGASGAIGSAVARAFAREGARLFLVARTSPRLEMLAAELAAVGARAEIAALDALDRRAVDEHANAVAKTAGTIDVSVNAVGFDHVQGTAFADLALDDYLDPIRAYCRTNFVTAQAAARHMVLQGRGVILTLSTPGARLSGKGFLGNGVASAGVEAFSRILAGELGSSGVRVVCLRPDAIPEALPRSHTGRIFGENAARLGITAEAMLAERAQGATLLGRLPTLDQVARTAAFLASDGAGAMTGAIVNLTCGSLVD